LLILTLQYRPKEEDGLETPTNLNRSPLDPLDTLDHILKESQKLREKGEQVLQTTTWDSGKSETDRKTEEPAEELAPLELGR
jgi:hypothetical protein